MRVVVNADDFGLSEDTVEATIDAVRAGEISSATLMAAMPASDAAIEFARSSPHVSFGVHLTFVGDGEERPLSAPEDVATLVDRNGRLRATNLVRLAALVGRLSVEEIAREVVAQVEWVRARGVPVSHVDSHRHLHKYGPFRQALSLALPRLGIRRVRNVQDVYLRRPLVSPTARLGGRWRHELMARFTTTDHFYMPASAGDATWDTVLDLVREDATLEVGVHPGSREEWRVREREGVARFAEALRERRASLVSWREI